MDLLETESVCIGDYICLFCEDTSGFVYSDQTSAAYNGVFVYNEQNRDKPAKIPNIHAITFEIVSQNRYKLEKKYRRLVSENGTNSDDQELKTQLEQAKLAAEAEKEDNAAEQSRLRGKQLKYGHLVQLRHVLTNKYIHISTTDTSGVDKNKMMVKLETYNAKHAQFRIMPRYKVKMEGEKVEVNDRIILESVKSPGTYLHASLPYAVNHTTLGSELNLGVEIATFTIMHHLRPTDGDKDLIKAGSVISLFHKELQAHMTAEGVFDEQPTEGVHLRVREFNQMDMKTLFYPKSGIAYWQVETTSSILEGRIIRWEDQIKLRHMTTRLYLTVTQEGQLELTEDSEDPNAVFCFHAFNQNLQDDTVVHDMNTRIQHVLTGSWLHANADVLHVSQPFQGSETASMDRLREYKTTLLKVQCSADQQFPDAFTIQKVDDNDVCHFNYVAGMVPFVRNLTLDRRAKKRWSAKRCANICSAFTQLRDFMVVDSNPVKDKQKLLRNLKVLDVLVGLLSCNADDIADWEQLSAVFRSIYEVLHAYTKGRSKKNALYLAKYIRFFETQLARSRRVGLHCCIMLTELIRDNRKIVDRMKPQQIINIITLLKRNKNFHFLELLGVLCVCDSIAISDNQALIAENLLLGCKEVICHLELGQDIERADDIIYVSADNRITWHALHKFVYKSNPEYVEEQYLFLDRQLDLYKQLCYGRNKVAIKYVTKNREFFTWDVAFNGLKSDVLPDKIRARFCDLIIGLFVDVGDNFSTIELSTNNFIYDEIDATNPDKDETGYIPRQLESHFPVINQWLEEFFIYNPRLYASNPAYNMFVKQVLRLTTYLVKYGYLASKQDIYDLMARLRNYIDGNNDAPFPPDKGQSYSKEEEAQVHEYRTTGRFAEGTETEAIVEAKIQGLELMELILLKHLNRKVKYLVTSFKGISTPKKKKVPTATLR